MTFTLEEHRRAMFAPGFAYFLNPADNCMKWQLEKTLAEVQKPDDAAIPGADDESAKRDRVLS